MNVFTYTLDTKQHTNLGLIVLQTDETIEQDFRKMIPDNFRLYISRVPNEPEVTRDTLQRMENHIPASTSLFPNAMHFHSIGYGCTSGTAQIGQKRIGELIQSRLITQAVTEPVSALIAACRFLNIKQLAFLSPYIEDVSKHLRQVIASQGIATPIFGTFAEADDAKVAAITADSIAQAAIQLTKDQPIDGLFLSCTNLHTLDVIPTLEETIGVPVLSSNQVLAWHMAQLADKTVRLAGPGTLFQP